MAFFLAIETSSVNCSVALISGTEVLALRELNQGYSHAENLHPFIAEVLKKSSMDKSKLDAVIVGSGPGSFTGLRIGSSAAKGLAFALNIPLMSYSSLENMAELVRRKENALDENTLLCPLIDARRMEVYNAIFDMNMKKLLEDRAVIVDETSFAKLLSSQKVCFFGDGAEKIRPLYESHPNACFVKDVFPSAQTMQHVSEKYYQVEKFEETAYFEPFYLKGFHATTPKKQL